MNSICSSIRMISQEGSCPITTFKSGVRLQYASQGPLWNGIRLESGIGGRHEGQGLLTKGHLIMMHLEPAPIPTEILSIRQSRWVPVRYAPGDIQIHSGGQPYFHRTDACSVRWAAAIIDCDFLSSVMGCPYTLDQSLDVADPVLTYLFHALLSELMRPSQNVEVTKALVRTFVLALGARHGVVAGALLQHRGEDQLQLERVLSWIDENLENSFSVGDLARQTGLSEGHFSRLFKKETQQTPWAYISETRLKKARQLLTRGEAVCETAALCGFFDQSHLSRHFKQRFGQSPAAFKRAWSGQPAFDESFHPLGHSKPGHMGLK